MESGRQNSLYFYKEDDIDVEKIALCKDSFGTIEMRRHRSWTARFYPVPNGFTQDLDILLPCALENQRIPEPLAKISNQAKVICEEANGLTTPDYDVLIKKRISSRFPTTSCATPVA